MFNSAHWSFHQVSYNFQAHLISKDTFTPLETKTDTKCNCLNRSSLCNQKSLESEQPVPLNCVFTQIWKNLILVHRLVTEQHLEVEETDGQMAKGSISGQGIGQHRIQERYILIPVECFLSS